METLPFVLRASAKACGEGMVQVRSWRLWEHSGPPLYRLGAGQVVWGFRNPQLFRGATPCPCYIWSQT